MAQVINATPAPVAPTDASQMRPARRWFDTLWAVLTDPRLLVVIAALLLAVLVVSVLVPQLPGQLRSEPLAADRWLTTAAESTGS